MGVGFGVATPLFTGGFNRTAAAFAGLADGIYGVDSMLRLMLDAIFIFPYDFIVEGAQNVVVGIEFGALFAVSGFIIDRLNATKNEIVSIWGSWIFAVVAGASVLLFSLLGPAEFLRDLAV